MVQNKKIEMWDQYVKRIDEKGKERYQCKACNKEWAKNATRLQEHLKVCVLRNSTSNESSESFELPGTNKKRKQPALDNFAQPDQTELESLLA
ncbi:19256_t:CDS:1, partial [Racocetra fulgida]